MSAADRRPRQLDQFRPAPAFGWRDVLEWGLYTAAIVAVFALGFMVTLGVGP